MSEEHVKHDWAHAPTNSGSTIRPYRFNWRLDPSEHAQVIDIALWLRDEILCDKDLPLCKSLLKGLLAIQHLRRHIKWGDTQQRNYARQFFEPLDRSDYLVERGKRLIAAGVLTRSHFEQSTLKI